MFNVLKRFNQAIKPCHLLAYLLHPKYMGAKLDSQLRDQAHKWLIRVGIFAGMKYYTNSEQNCLFGR